MKRKFLSLLLILFLSCIVACTSPTDAMVERAKVVVASSLKDPSSATYQNIFVMQLPKPNSDNGEAKWVVCGEVNSKNSLGGYVGYQRFIVRNDSTAPLYDGQLNSQSEKELFNTMYQGFKSSIFSKSWK